MDIWMVSTFELLWLMWLWPFMYKFLYGHVFSFLLCIYLGVELFGHLITLCWIFFLRTARLFSTVATPFFSSISSVWGSHFPISSPTIVIICLIDYSPPRRMKWYHIMIFISNSLITSDVEIFSFICGVHLCSFFRQMSIQILCPIFSQNLEPLPWPIFF